MTRSTKTRRSRRNRPHRFHEIAHGIGQVSYNDRRLIDGEFREVREVYMTTVTGDARVRFNLEAETLEPFQGEVDLTVEQAREVLARAYELIAENAKAVEEGPRPDWMAPAPKLKPILPGDPFGTVSRNTTYGLYDGRRPRWMDKARWQELVAANA